MTAQCPHCNAPIEFRFDDSFVRICDHCNTSVVRTDRGVDTLGQFADLTPMASPLRLFAEGRDRASSFLLVGMAQLRHAQGGMWQEWYAKLDDGWGWLSEAQGRYYMTYEAPDVPAPPFLSLGPGATIAIEHGGVSRAYTVGEMGSAAYAGARGEIPYRLVPGAAFRFADLSAADGSFVTIDYGDPADPAAQPTVYVGRQIGLAELQLSGGEALPEQAPAAITAARIACPSCNGPLDLRAPEQTQRIACPYCGTLVSVGSGPAAILGKQKQVPKPELPLGSKATFSEGELQIIGYLKRSAEIDGAWYGFEEYLLFAPAVGFRWLVQSDGHWSYVQPIAPGAVEMDNKGQRYDGVTFRQFQDSTLRVDAVLGEFYWQVAAGEVVRATDFIAPPAMLSVERSGTEESWSLGTYVSPAALRAALGKPDFQVAGTGVAPNQPPRAQLAVTVMSFGLFVLLGLGLVFAMTSSNTRRLAANVTVPNATAAALATAPGSDGSAVDPAIQTAYFSPPFHLAAGQNIELQFDAAIDNDWVYAAADLVEDATGTVISVDAELEHYSGVEDGESWAEGDASKSEILGPVPAGDYVLRVESQHGSLGAALLQVTVRQDVFRGWHLMLALLVLMVPYTIVGWANYAFEKRRWENSTLPASAHASYGGGWAFWGVRGLVIALGAIISAFANSRSSDD